MTDHSFLRRASLSTLFLSTGVALLAHILIGMNLRIALIGSLCLAFLFIATIWRKDRCLVLGYSGKVIKEGMLIGIVSTAAYDVVRYILVHSFDMSVKPFEAWLVFGEELTGTFAPNVPFAIGTLFHLANGIGFAAAYILLVQKKGFITGFIWAMGLEAMMLALYPGWLGINLRSGFLEVSAVGHAAYGLTLGGMSKLIVVHYGARKEMK